MSDDTKKMPQEAFKVSNAYALTLRGECMLPDIKDGQNIIVDPDRIPQAGDLVAVWLTDDDAPMLKRLMVAPPPAELFKGANFTGVLVLKEQNPPRTFLLDADRVKAVHVMIGKAD